MESHKLNSAIFPRGLFSRKFGPSFLGNYGEREHLLSIFKESNFSKISLNILGTNPSRKMVVQVRKTKQSQGNDSVLCILGLPNWEGSRKECTKSRILVQACMYLEVHTNKDRRTGMKTIRRGCICLEGSMQEQDWMELDRSEKSGAFSLGDNHLTSPIHPFNTPFISKVPSYLLQPN